MTPDELERHIARELRLSVIQGLYDDGDISEEDAKGLLAAPLTPGDDSTFADDSYRLVVKEPVADAAESKKGKGK